MVGFTYTYTEPLEIMNNINILSSFWMIEYILLFILFISFLVIFWFLLPALYIWSDYRTQENIKMKKKIMLKRIIMQKDIESEIEKELGI